MAALAGDLSKKILMHSDAEMAFRPWWDTLEDNLLYSFVIYALILLPMTFLSGTPIECAVHPSLWEENSLPTPDEPLDAEWDEVEPEVVIAPNSINVGQTARFLRSYANKYCTEIYVSPFLLYFSFIMMVIPMVLIMVERVFIKFYGSEGHLEALYNSLVKTSLNREDVANLEKETVKNSHEMKQKFRKSSRAHDSYLYRTTVELIVSVILTIFFSGFANIKGLNRPLFDCDVHGILYKCIIPNSRFFNVVYFIGLFSLIGYMALTSYNLLWLVHPKVGKLEKVLSGCKRRSSKSFEELEIPKTCVNLGKGEGCPPEIRLDMYYDKKARDFRLLMNLLAEQPNGLSQSFRLLCVFDKHFQRLWKTQDHQVILKRPHQTLFDADKKLPQDNGDAPRSALVVWNDAAICPYIHRTIPRAQLEYTVEIAHLDKNESLLEAPVKSQFYHDIPDFTSISSETKSLIVHMDSTLPKKSFSTASTTSSMSNEEFGLNVDSMYKYSARFDGLDDKMDYVVSISTELDGKTVAQVTMTVSKMAHGPQQQEQHKVGSNEATRKDQED